MNRRMTKKYTWLLLAAEAAIIAAIFGAQYYRNRPQAGSFEYVRKGMDLLHKGRVRDSLRYFEKAYLASPESEDIRLSLIYACSRYASDLADKKDYNKAILYLTRACDVEMTSDTAQNLAVMYSKRAEEKLAAGREAAGVRKDFEAGRDLVAGSGRAARGFGISLYNDAVAMFKKGKDDAAILLLKESALAYPHHLTFEALGDVYYKKTDFEKARFFYAKAEALDPQDSRLREKTKKAARELELAGLGRSIASPHFELRYRKGMALDEDSTKRTLEKCYFDVGSDLKYFPSSKTIVFLYTYGDFRKVFKMPLMVRAFYDGNIHIPLPDPALGGEDFSRYLRHEYTHAVVSAMTGSNCPVWLSEGLAVWEEYKDNEEIVSGFFRGPFPETGLSLNALEKAFTLDGRNEDELRAYYLLSYSVVKYMIDNWGIGGIRNILGRVKEGRHIVNAIEDEFLLSEKEFEQRWHSYLLRFEAALSKAAR